MAPTSQQPPSSDEEGNNSNREDNLAPKKSDVDCYNCIGVYFYSDELRKLGKKPVCYGVEYKASSTVPPARMSELEKLPPIEANTKTYLIGLSQSSGRMHRMGQIPLVKYGIQATLQHIQEGEEGNNNNAIPSSRKAQNRPNNRRRIESTQSQEDYDPTMSPPNSQIPKDQKPPMSTLETMVSKMSVKSLGNFLEAYQKNCSKLWNGMGVVMRKAMTNFPERMYKGAERVGGGCVKMADRTVESLKKIFGDNSK